MLGQHAHWTFSQKIIQLLWLFPFNSVAECNFVHLPSALHTQSIVYTVYKFTNLHVFPCTKMYVCTSFGVFIFFGWFFILIAVNAYKYGIGMSQFENPIMQFHVVLHTHKQCLHIFCYASTIHLSGTFSSKLWIITFSHLKIWNTC